MISKKKSDNKTENKKHFVLLTGFSAGFCSVQKNTVYQKTLNTSLLSEREQSLPSVNITEKTKDTASNALEK